MTSKQDTATKPDEFPVEESLVVDASNIVAGRIASIVAKQLLLGKHVIVINAEKAVLSGNRASLINEYKEYLGIRTRTAPWKGPFHRRQPHNILRRIIRGMVPWDKARGRAAMRRLRVYTGTPQDIEITRRLDLHDFERIGRRTIYLGEIAKELGWKGM
ncbi:MAG: 50S ribosomal protein L13 [Promethearchaeota archaeon]